MIRIHQSPLSRIERVVLDCLVRRVPDFVSPDMLTGFGVVGAVITFIGYAMTLDSELFLWLASFGLVIHWLGDSLDGNLARFRKTERPRYGFFIDQSVDVVSNLLIGLGIGISPFVRVETALLAISGYHMLTIYALVRVAIDRVFHVTVLGSGPTEIRALLIIMNTIILVLGAPTWTAFGVEFAWCDLTMGAFGAGFIIAFVYLVQKDARRLRLEDDAARLPLK